MENKTTEPQNDENALESLEGGKTQVEPVVVTTPSQSSATDATSSAPANPPQGPPSKNPFHRFAFLNVYLIIFGVVLLVFFAAALLAYHANKRGANAPTISSQTLDQKALEQLASSDATVGSSAQVLNVQSSAVFAGKVLVRDGLEVAGPLQVGGSLSLAGITVSGNSSFDQVQVQKDLAIAGDTALQGALNVQKNLSVNGSGTFKGPLSASQLTISSLQLNGDLTLTHHITAGGATPSRSNGPALGSGGTASVSGSDSSGSISINTGSSAATGCFITVTFASKFNATPHVIITPVGSSAAGLNYYVNRSTSNFSICTISAPPSNATFGFDYLVLD